MRKPILYLMVLGMTALVLFAVLPSSQTEGGPIGADHYCEPNPSNECEAICWHFGEGEEGEHIHTERDLCQDTDDQADGPCPLWRTFPCPVCGHTIHVEICG